MKNVFITDLDRTIIHSKNPDFTCVEKNGEKEITYMTDKSIELLNGLLDREDFIFVPCTMRRYNQVKRVNFLGNYTPKFMICENGAQIFINETLDKEWEAHMRGIVNKEDVEEGIKRINSLGLDTRQVLNIDDFYISISFYDEKESEKSFKAISELFKKPFEVIRAGRKIFVIHNKIDKFYAVEYIVKKFGIEEFITSGDSDADKRFTTLGTSILPSHASFRHENSVVTKKSGVHSTEDILELVKDTFFE